MEINVNCESSSSSSETKMIINKVLNIIELNQKKELEDIRLILFKLDSSLTFVLDGLLKHNAVFCVEEKTKTKTKTFLNIRNKNSIFYALSKLKDVSNEEDLLIRFEFWYNSTETPANKSFHLLKELSLEDAFKTYMTGDFYDFCVVTDFCDKLYKKYEESKLRQPCLSPYPIIQNVIYRSSYTPSENILNKHKVEESLKEVKKDNDITIKESIDKQMKSSNEKNIMNKNSNTNDKKSETKSKLKTSSVKPITKKQTKHLKEELKQTKTKVIKKNTKVNEKTTNNKSNSNAKTSKSVKAKKEMTVEAIVKPIKTPKTTKPKVVKIIKSKKPTVEQKLNDINVKISKSFFQFERISMDFINEYASKIEEKVCLEELIKTVKTNLDHVDKIRRELKKLSRLRRSFNDLKVK